MALDVLDLFSGIGGFSVGLHKAGLTTKAFCEIDPKCRKELRKNFPDVPVFGDVSKLTGSEGAVDVICGGFPCQPYSTASAGRAKGAEDPRALWPEMFRLVREIRPRYVLGENVEGFISMDLVRVVSDLASEDYEVECFIIPACAVGQDHRRNRVWIVGHTDSCGKSKRGVNEETPKLSYSGSLSGELGEEDGVSVGVRDKMKMLGNSVVPDVVEIFGRIMVENGRIYG